MDTRPQITSGRFWSAVATVQLLIQGRPLTKAAIMSHLVAVREAITPDMAADAIGLLFSCKVVWVNQNDELSIQKGFATELSRKNSDRQGLAQSLLREFITTSRQDLSVIGHISLNLIREDYPEIFEILRDSGLTNIKNPGYEGFWSRVRDLGRFKENSSLDQRKFEKGQLAERLSLAFEVSRLENLSRPDLAEKVALVSENTHLGYDIYSFKGEGEQPSNPIKVEVKNLSRDAGGRLFFHLTRHEAETASQSPNNYIFHLWNTYDENPVCISKESKAVLRHLPTETSPDVANWESCILFLEGITDSLNSSSAAP